MIENTPLQTVLDATWPPLDEQAIGPVIVRHGTCGGSRVSAARVTRPLDDDDLIRAEQAMRDLGQTPMVQVWAGQDDLDAQLAARGYQMRDATLWYQAPVDTLAAADLPFLTVFRAWPLLAIQREIWDAGGIRGERRAIMDRVQGPKTGLFGRISDAPGGAAFIAAHDGIAMLHAMEILERHRRKGLAQHMITGAARWAQDQGCHTLGLLVTADNTAANALYAQTGFSPRPAYHYRVLD